MEQEL